MSHKQCYEKRDAIQKQLEAAQVRIKELEAENQEAKTYAKKVCLVAMEEREKKEQAEMKVSEIEAQLKTWVDDPTGAATSDAMAFFKMKARAELAEKSLAASNAENAALLNVIETKSKIGARVIEERDALRDGIASARIEGRTQERRIWHEKEAELGAEVKALREALRNVHDLPCAQERIYRKHKTGIPCPWCAALSRPASSYARDAEAVEKDAEAGR